MSTSTTLHPVATGVPVLGDDEARAVAADLAPLLAAGAVERDLRRELPASELDSVTRAGLLALTVPAEHGGADLSTATLVEVVRVLATGDPNVAQIPHSHFVYVNALRHQGTPAQRRHLFGEVLAGKRFGNAQSELGTKHVRDHRTTLTHDPERPGRWRLDGQKGYCTGALLADWVPVLAHRDVDGPMVVAWVERHAPGVTVVDDWDGLGQRTTASGRVTLVDVKVPDALVTPYHLTFTGPQTYGAFGQVLHAAIDAGIARAALVDAAVFVTTRSRPYPDAGVERHADDPLVVQAVGEMELQVRGAEALLAHAAAAVDAADAHLTGQSAATASLAVAAARAATSRAAVEVSSRLFEVCGTRSAAAGAALDRHWRNARVHTLHDPEAQKVRVLGQWALDGTLPTRHGHL
ncbi:MAG: SfnB family sulfur acquisition oxidoreductase [Nocardioides sp.]|nr:SfnB family sulfur acquisition oxidoreductase [Nocardioides sp.]